LGIVAPGGNAPAEFFDNLLAGRSAIRVLPEDCVARLRTRIGAAAAFEPGAHFPAARVRMLDRVSQLALVAARQAVASSGIALGEEERGKVGVFFGTGMGGAATTDGGYATFYGEKS